MILFVNPFKFTNFRLKIVHNNESALDVPFHSVQRKNTLHVRVFLPCRIERSGTDFKKG